ncbi:MAG: hypothetical protein NC935_07455 [Candidatus Omnitrophica bacterium]|nr:hypothetical protein [Candidatus Omnitrophota bacterium]
MKKLLKIWPTIVISVFILFLAFSNITPNTYFTGWDNLHPEFNLLEYSKRVIFGAWAEHQGTGAPAAQSQLCEIPRLPIIIILSLILPQHLIRYVFHFLMLFIGSLGIFFYLKKYWLNQLEDKLKNWISLFGAFYYILNIFTLQQFYISFELFAVQFAFLPLVLISINDLLTTRNEKNLVKFIIFQLLIAPSAHTPTVFYLSYVFFLIYGFFVAYDVKKNIFQSLKNTFYLFILIFFIQGYWIIPNLYYLFKNSHYVTESRANILFNQESKWSIIEAADFKSLITGVHYLFTWKDFNFKKLSHEYIFSEWFTHFYNPFIFFLLIFFNLLALFGFFYVLFDKSKKWKRFGILTIFIFSLLLVWSGIFLPSSIIKLIYKLEPIKEAFRNPFTKLQILYSFSITILITTTLEAIINQLSEVKKNHLNFLIWGLIFFCFISIFIVYKPAFFGQFINEKLRTGIPSQYFKMYAFLNLKKQNLRVLELPFLSDSGWVLHNWSFDKEISGYKGYQGLGINFFGLNQPYFTSDFARWTETTDFFYHELRQGLNSEDSFLLKKIFKKYLVGYIIIDESLIPGYKNQYDYQRLHNLIKKTGSKKIWQEKNLSIYEFPNKNTQLLIPEKITFVNKGKTKRVKKDIAFIQLGDYIEKEEADIIFPFADFFSSFLENIYISNNSIRVQKKLPIGDYNLNLSEVNRKILNETPPYKVEFKNREAKFWFPKIKIYLNNQIIPIILIEDFNIKTNKNYDAILLKNEDKEYLINKGSSLHGFIKNIQNLNLQIIGINYDQKDKSVFYPDKEIIQIKPSVNFIDYNYQKEVRFSNLDEIIIEYQFPNIIVNLKKQPSENCNHGKVGSIKTDYELNHVVYTAKDYGVNCNSLPEKYLVTNQSYLIKIEGENLQGRSVKFFLNYDDSNILTEDFIMPEGKFNKVKTITAVTQKESRPLYLNWETRSFGKTSKNILKAVTISPLPLEAISNIKLTKNRYLNGYQRNNNLKVRNFKSIFNFIYLIKTDCPLKECYLGLNTSYDSLWLAFDRQMKILPHFKLNNWANIWQVKNGSDNLVVIYLPQIISLLIILMLISYTFLKIVNLINKIKIKS